MSITSSDIEQQEVITTKPQAPWRWMVLLLTLVLAGVGGWWGLQPRGYQYVARIPAGDATLVPSPAGFLLRQGALTFAFYNWQGQQQWQVTVPQPSYPDWQTADAHLYAPGFAVGLSPNGRLFAAAVAAGAQTHLQIWRDGREIDNRTFTEANPFQIDLRLLDSGRLFLWYDRKRTAPVIAVEGGKTIARGALLPGSLMSPDGKTIVSRSIRPFAYATVRVREGKITLTNRYTGSDPLDINPFPLYAGEFALFDQGYVLAGDGALYGPGGRLSIASKWRHDTKAPGGMYTLEYNGNKSRVVSPVTGDSWEFPVPGINHGGDATPDGRFALAYYSTEISEPLRHISTRVTPREDDPAKKWAETLALYERPGHRILTIHRDAKQWHRQAGDATESYWYPSPDGKAIVMLYLRGDKAYECVVLRRK